MAPERTLSLAVVAVEESTASTLYGMHDLMASVGRDWAYLMTGVPGMPRIRSQVVAATPGPMRIANGVVIHPDCAFAEAGRPDLVCVPDLFVAPDEPIAGRFPAAVDWLRRCYEAGATLASACSGGLLLAEAGLLDGAAATTHWAYAEAMRRYYPRVEVQEARVLVTTGEGQRIVTAGGGSSWNDLALFLIARFFGQEEAMRMARLYLLDWHRNGQLPYAALSCLRQPGDAAIARCQEWLGENYRSPAPVAAMAALSGLSERSFKRRFVKAAGMTPIDYVHTLRLEEAKQILETTDMPVEAVANEVGYEDGSFFRRLFRRKVGMAPAEYRRRFATVRRALAEAERMPA